MLVVVMEGSGLTSKREVGIAEVGSEPHTYPMQDQESRPFPKIPASPLDPPSTMSRPAEWQMTDPAASHISAAGGREGKPYPPDPLTTFRASSTKLKTGPRTVGEMEDGCHMEVLLSSLAVDLLFCCCPLKLNTLPMAPSPPPPSPHFHNPLH